MAVYRDEDVVKAICEMFDPPDMTVSDVIEVAPTRVRQLLAKFPGLSKEQFSRCMEIIFYAAPDDEVYRN